MFGTSQTGSSDCETDHAIENMIIPWNPSPNQKDMDVSQTTISYVTDFKQAIYWNNHLFLVGTGVPGPSVFFTLHKVKGSFLWRGETQQGICLMVGISLHIFAYRGHAPGLAATNILLCWCLNSTTSLPCSHIATAFQV